METVGYQPCYLDTYYGNVDPRLTALVNSQRFKPRQFTGSPIETKIEYIDTPGTYLVQVNELSDDSNLLVSLPGFTENEINYVQVEFYAANPNNSPAPNSYTFQMSMDSKQVSRSMSNFVDSLGAAGGITALFLSLSYSLNQMCSYNK